MFSWKNYPIQILQPLLQGSVGQLQLGTLAEMALNLSQKSPPEQAKFLLKLACQMLLQIWEGDVLNGTAATNLLNVHKFAPICSSQVLAFARLIAKGEVPQDLEEYQKLVRLQDKELALQYIEMRNINEPNNLFWVRSGEVLAHMEGQCAWFERWLSRLTSLPKSIQQGLLGDACYGLGNFEKASKLYGAALRAFPSLTWRERWGDALYESGQRDGAIEQWKMVIDQRPWHVSLRLKLFDVLHGRDLPSQLPKGQGAILLYTWNKAHCLNQSIQSIAASDFGHARVVVFDNGSTDTTPEIIKVWQDKLGSRMSTFRAPCNIGAPAARNWLLTMPETQDCEWVTYLDDDAEVPKDWLRLFGTAMQAYPNQPVFGCRVVNHNNTQVVQSADIHLREGGVLGSMKGGENGAEPGHVQRFSFSNLQAEGADYKYFSFMRPCVSVTGCCHLFRRKALDSIGHFDLRFSPSQYDDLEHDIRLALKGQWPVYQGHLRVKHMRQSGMSANNNLVSRMSIWSNLFKLQTKYTHEDYERIRLGEHEILLHDLLQKIEQS